MRGRLDGSATPEDFEKAASKVPWLPLGAVVTGRTAPDPSWVAYPGAG
jgi:hypothetical protein